MNLFRSEEPVRNWASFEEGTEDGIVPILDTIKMCSGPFLTRRMDPNYVSHIMEYRIEGQKVLKEIGKAVPFWMPKKPQ